MFALNQYGINNVMIIGFVLVVYGLVGKLVQRWSRDRQEKQNHNLWMFILKD